ncbi:hypothetical protein [Methyloglobulus sp.]|uniref:hypothetical protein n=1 Tax=Methyloglobulus sp. TaxID=2518622 RepID=UPI0032B71386
MKKHTKKQKVRNLRLQLKKAKRARKIVGHRKHFKFSKKRLSNLIEENKVVEILAPKEFALIKQENRDVLLNFLSNIKNRLEKGSKVNISFDDTQILLPCGTLWATAKIEYLISKYPNKLTCSYPRNDVVHQLFQHIGLLEKLGKHTRKIEINAENVKHWHYVSGKSTDDVSKFKTLLHSISLAEATRSGLYESMSEAVTNTIHWAYKGGQPKEWRMFAQYIDGKLTVAICDLGMGIPCSLREKPELKEYFSSPIHWAKNKRDTSLIEIAVESNRSKTKLPHRGKGLKDMLDLVKSGTVGGFRIYSNKGAFDYNASSRIEFGKDFKIAINGTIIQWQLSVESNHEQ